MGFLYYISTILRNIDINNNLIVAIVTIRDNGYICITWFNGLYEYVLEHQYLFFVIAIFDQLLNEYLL